MSISPHYADAEVSKPSNPYYANPNGYATGGFGVGQTAPSYYNGAPPQAYYGPPPQGAGAPYYSSSYAGAPPQAYKTGPYPPQPAFGIVVDDGGKPRPHGVAPSGGAPGAPAVIFISDADYSGLVGEAPQSTRMSFIRKVYLTLTIQLIVTFGVVLAFTFNKPLALAVAGAPGVLITSAIGSIVLLIALSCFPSVAKSYPGNVACLSLFTCVRQRARPRSHAARCATTLLLTRSPRDGTRPPNRIFESILVGSIASTYTTDSVVKALVATVVMTLALTLYAWQTRVDFTAMGGALLCLMIGVVMFGIWTAIFPSQAGQTAYCAAMAIVFAIFIVYDTQMILGGKHHSHAFQTDEWVFAALNVYIDIIQLFLQLLRLFVS